MSLTPQIIDDAVQRYWREFDRYKKLATWVGETCQEMLKAQGIRCSVQWRPKDPERLRAKLHKYLKNGEHASEFQDLNSVFHVLKDLAGVRITTYVEEDRARVIELIKERFVGFGPQSEVIEEVKDQLSGFYRATHCMVHLKDVDVVGPNHNLKGIGCEVQVCSQLAHVYHELEHDLRYKPLAGVLSKKETDLLDALARLMEVGDTIINQTRDAVETRLKQQSEDGVVNIATTESPISHVTSQFLKSLSDSPVFLDLARQIQSDRPDKYLPDNAIEFYQEIVRLLVSGALITDKKNTVPEPDTNDIMTVLPALAWQLFSNDPGMLRYAQSNLIDVIMYTTKLSAPEADRFLSALIERNLFIGPTSKASDQELEFAHVTIRDYLAASYIASQVNRNGWGRAHIEAGKFTQTGKTIRIFKLLDEKAFALDWQPLFVFTAGMLDDPHGLLLMLADRDKDDYCRHRLGLFCRCYRALSDSRQSEIASRIEFVFDEVLRIAKRCTHDDAGHRKPWLEWVEMLLASPEGANYFCAELLKLNGRYNGWTVSLKVLELFDRVLRREKVSPSVVDSIADFGLQDEHQGRTNAALLALRLASDTHKEILVSRFMGILEEPKIPNRVKIRLAEAVALEGHNSTSQYAGEKLVTLGQSDSLSYDDKEMAMYGIVSLLDTSLAPKAAMLLVNFLLNPSMQNYFWVAWWIIGKADQEPDSIWSGIFLCITLNSDRENDCRLKLWSAQALSKHPQAELQTLGQQILLAMALAKDTHSWVYAARWLVENATDDLVDQAWTALLDEASNLESTHRLEATAELLEMGAIDPDGGPIRETVHKAVLREIKEHGEKYGSRLNVRVPGTSKKNVDLELFADNPETVIKVLHSFRGPSPYIRDGDDPAEEEKRSRYWNAKLLYGTRFWPEALRNSIQVINDGAKSSDYDACDIVLYAAPGDILVDLLQKSMKPGRSAAITRHSLLEELYERGWRLRFCGRQIEVLYKGRDESIALVESGKLRIAE